MAGFNTDLNNVLPDQRVSFKTKQSAKWTKSMADYVVQLAISCNDKTRTADFLNMANGYIDKKMYEYVLKTYGLKEDSTKESILDDLREIDWLQPIKDKYLGEFVSSYNNYQVYTDDPNSIFFRNKEYGDKLIAVMQQMIINELNKTIETGQQSKETPDLDQLLKDHIDTWNDRRTEDAQGRLDLLNNVIDAKLKYNQLYYYWWATEECYTYRKIHKENVIFEIVSPLEYYRVPSGNHYVEDDEYGVRIFNRTLYQVLDIYSELLKPTDIAYLKTFTEKRTVETGTTNLLKSRLLEQGMTEDDYITKSSMMNDMITHNSCFGNTNDVKIAHYVFKTEVKVGYLTYQNIVGEIQETIVDENYELDLTNGDISIKVDWLQQLYEGEIIGYSQGSNNFESVYTKVRPIDIQRENFTNLNVCKSPYNGMSYIHADSSPKPIPFRMVPYIALARIYHYQIERAINKWKSILIIPQSALSDDPEMSTEERLANMNAESTLVINDATTNVNALQAMKEVATTATYNYINTLSGLLDKLKLDAWEVANMTPSRMGNQAAYQGKSVTEQSLAQSSISGNWSLEMFNLFRSSDYLANYDYSKIAWANGKQGSYVDESTNESKYIEVDPLEHFALNIGINVGNSRLLDEKLKAMKDVAFSASQNGDVELATEAIMNDNLQVLKSKVEDAAKAKKVYEQQMELSKQQSAQQIEAMKQQGIKDTRDFEIQKIQLENDGKKELELIKQEGLLLVWEQRLKVDTNGNGYIDENETYGEAINRNQQQQEVLSLARAKFEFEKKKHADNLAQKKPSSNK